MRNYKPMKVILTRESYLNLTKKSGIYCWTNKINGKQYVGSAVNLRVRVSRYTQPYYMISKGNTTIMKAFLKYGYSNFELSILEFCDSSVLLIREQYWLDNLKPAYNMAKIAGNTLGVKHRLDVIELLQRQKLGVFWTLERKQKFSKYKIENPNNVYPVKITNIYTGEIIHFKSIQSAAKFMGSTHSFLRKSNGYVVKLKYCVDIDTSIKSANTKLQYTDTNNKYVIIKKLNNDLALPELKFRLYSECAEFLGLPTRNLKLYLKHNPLIYFENAISPGDYQIDIK